MVKELSESVVEKASSWMQCPFNYTAKIPKQYWEVAFFSLILIYNLLLIREALSYGENARIFPLLIAIPLTVMLAVQILLLVFHERLEISFGGLFSDVTQEFIDVSGGGTEVSEPTKQLREFSSMLWAVGFTGLIWFVGFIEGLPPLIFLYVYYHDRSIVRALVVTVIVTAFIFILFIEILNSPLWEGIVEITL